MCSALLLEWPLPPGDVPAIGPGRPRALPVLGRRQLLGWGAERRSGRPTAHRRITQGSSRPAGARCRSVLRFRWYEEHARRTWPEDLPSWVDTREHAKCLRSPEEVRDYFRDYRAKKKQQVRTGSLGAGLEADWEAGWEAWQEGCFRGYGNEEAGQVWA